MRLTGQVTEVVTEPTKTGVTVDASAGAGELTVESVAGFPSQGTIRLTMLEADDDLVTEDIDYIDVDPDDNTITLDGVTTNPFPVESLVELLLPAQPTTTVFVATNDNQEDLSAYCPQELKAVYATALADGIREPGLGVSVVAAEVFGRWTIVEVKAPPSIASENLTGLVPEDLLPEIPTASDGDPPTDPPVVTARSIPGFVQLTWELPTNPDVLIGSRVYVGTDASVAANSGTQHSIVGGTLALIRTLPDGTPLTPGTTYWFRVAVEDYDGVGPASTAVAASVGFQSTPDIATGSVTASMLQSVLVLASMFVGKDPPRVVVNKALTSNVATLTTETPHGLEVGAVVSITGIDSTFNGTYTIASVPSTTTFTYARTASNVSSTAVVGGLADPSQRWEADVDGIRFYDTAGVPVIVLPTDASPSNPASFYGSLVAVGLIVLDNLSVSGDNNELAAGATFTLKSGVTAPSVAPTTIAAVREGPAFNLSSLTGEPWNGVWDYDGGSWWLIYLDDDPASDVMYLCEFDPAGGDPVDVTELPQQFDEYPEQLVKIGNHVFSLVDDDGGRTLYWNLSSLVDGVEVEGDDGYIGRDYINDYLTYTRLSAGTQYVISYNPATMVQVGSTLTRTATYVRRVDRTAADWGANRYTMYDSSGSKVKVFTTSGTTLVEEPDKSFDGWQYEFAVGGGVVWNGTRFVSRAEPFGAAATVRLREYSNITFAESVNRKWWVGTTWRKVDATGPDYAQYETELGKKSTVTMKKRWFLTVTHPTGPTSPADAVSFYLGTGTTEPANADMERLAPPVAGDVSVEYDAVTLTGTGEPPTVNGFPGGSPSAIAAQEGGFSVSSESAGEWHKKKATPRFVGHLSTNQSIATGSTAVIIDYDEDTVDCIDDGYWTYDGAGSLTVDVAGVWRVTAHAQYSANATGDLRRISVFVNGVKQADASSGPAATGRTNLSIPAYSMTLAAGDVITIRAEHNRGSALTLQGDASIGNTMFTAVYEGPAT